MDKEIEIKPAYEANNKINQNQFFDLITGEELSWQSIIYDLIRTEQLDPWDIDIGVLADKYVEIIQQLEEANFFVSSKVLLACSLLLRLKSEILANSYIQELDDALYGKKEDKRYEIERLEIDEGELPILVPRTPMSRHKKVTLTELMNALNKAVETENRRIRREITERQAEKSSLTVLPRGNHVPLKVRVKNVFSIITGHIKRGNNHLEFSSLALEKEEKLASFVPVLHLANDGKIFLRQKVHFDEILMTLKIHDEELIEIENELSRAEELSEDFETEFVESLEEETLNEMSLEDIEEFSEEN